MKLNRLYKRLRREIRTNPGKAGVLGLLLLVALYYWTPLVWGWVAPDRPADASMAEVPSLGAAAAGPAAPTQPVPTPSAASKPETHPWEQLVQWIEQDPATCPVADLSAGRDPFRAVKPETPETETDDTQQQPEPVPPVLTPQSLGLQLSSTVIGPRRRVALIDGKTYQEGQAIYWAGDGQEIEFRLAEVHPRRVVLQWMGERFELAIPQPKRSGRIELFGSGN